MFLVRSFLGLSFSSNLIDSSAFMVRSPMGTLMAWYLSRVPSSRGLVLQFAFLRSTSPKLSVLTMIRLFGGMSGRLTLSAAGLNATRTSGRSPGVWMSLDENWIWKPETPGSDPAGARISAGKSGNVARSFPRTAVVLVKWPPISCIPSPESPANRITTVSIVSRFLGAATSEAVGGVMASPLKKKPRRTGASDQRRKIIGSGPGMWTYPTPPGCYKLYRPPVHLSSTGPSHFAFYKDQGRGVKYVNRQSSRTPPNEQGRYIENGQQRIDLPREGDQNRRGAPDADRHPERLEPSGQAHEKSNARGLRPGRGGLFRDHLSHFPMRRLELRE